MSDFFSPRMRRFGRRRLRVMPIAPDAAFTFAHHQAFRSIGIISAPRSFSKNC